MFCYLKNTIGTEQKERKPITRLGTKETNSAKLLISFYKLFMIPKQY